ncbi:ATP-binding protein [Streptomyces actuosus]|uniref:ATP-binding protein n=1 Tax=Streptomyces actuosus TaxID=1885 RepID=A0ABS2VLS6_STRAS|nr:FxSxx-COOH system tetratricopeptide repeat protein [Streptomyces actuosus]MBN0044064.1 ATP-binding protein [Streptomyces actuosus]
MGADDAAPRPRIEAAGERSIAAERIGVAFTGDVLPAEALSAPEKVAAPPGFSNLPPAVLCLGREEELGRLRRMLTDGQEGTVPRSGAVHGLGGIGKSTLALHYAHRHRGDYTLIWWINAASPDEIETSLTALTRTLVPGWAAAAARAEQLSWAVQWLAWHPGWLLVHDNVEDPDDLSPYTGALHQGHHLATSRRATGWPDGAPALTLGTLAPDDATGLLCRLSLKGTAPTARQQADARALADDLGHFPLAIKQAGAYLAQNRGIKFDAYRRRLGSRLARTAHGIDTERTIARIWNVTLATLRENDPPAVEVLQTAAWLAPDGIPHSLLAPPGADPDDTDDVAEAIGTLAAYSMVTDTGTSVGIHRLVQSVLRSPHHRDDTASPLHPPGRERAEQAVLHHLIPPPGRISPTDSQWDTLTPHLIALAATTPPKHLNALLTAAYGTAAARLHRQGHTARTVPLYESALTAFEQVLGEAHPQTLQCRSNLAAAHHAAGDLERAVALYQTTLTQSEQTLGDTHPSTLISRNNLAATYESAGELERAVALYQTTLTQSEQTLGDTHPSTLISRNNLAATYESAGDLERAVALYQTTLTQSEQTLGDTHPDTLISRNNLAHAYRTAGDLKRAIPLYETTLTQREQTLGDTHPSTLVSRNNLAHAYRSAGDLERAIPLYQTTLTQSEQTLGDTHPDTLVSRNNLAQAYRTAGDLKRAVRLLETTLAQRERVLGDAHPHARISRDNLADARRAAGEVQPGSTGT